MSENPEDKRKVLVIDDEPENRELIEQILIGKFQVYLAADGEEGVTVARREQPDLILLDITMPKLDGIAACEALRSNEATRHIPIIMVTASGDIDNRIKAFLTGVDDFLAKPFSPKELVARVNSKIRRVDEKDNKQEVLQCGNLNLDLHKLEAKINGNLIALSVLEFSLLKYLVLNRNRVLSREKILEAVWRDAVVSDRTVDTHMVSLRKKLIGFDHLLTTVYGAGYILKKE